MATWFWLSLVLTELSKSSPPHRHNSGIWYRHQPEAGAGRKYQIRKLPNYQITNITEGLIFTWQIFSNYITKLPNYQITNINNWQINLHHTKLPNYQSNSGVIFFQANFYSKLPNYTITKLPNYKITKLQNN